MENLSVALEAQINQFQSNLATAAKAVQDFSAKTSRVGDTKIKLSTDTAALSKALAVLAEAERAISGFAASAKGIQDVSFDVTADTSTLSGLQATLKQAAATLQAFRQQAQQTDGTQVNLIVTGTDFTRLEANLTQATASVQAFARQAERVKAASLEVKTDTSGIDTLRAQLTEATRAMDAFAQKAQQDTSVHLKVEADESSINHLKTTLDEALTSVQRFAAQSANNIGIDVTVNADSNILPQLQAELNTSLAAVKSFSIDASNVAGVKVNTDTSSLNALQTSLTEAANAIAGFAAKADSTGEVEVRVQADTSDLDGLRTKLNAASEQIKTFAEKATTTAEVDLKVNAASIDISSLKGKIDEAIGYINKLSGAQANSVDITLDAQVTGLPKVQAQLQQASQAVQDFADKANAGAKVDLKVEADTADVAQLKDVLGSASAALKDFTADATGVASVDLKLAADTASLDGLKVDLKEAASAIKAFSALASGTAGIKVNTDTSELAQLQAQLKQSEAAFQSFQAKAQAAGNVDLSINVSGSGLDSIQHKLDAAALAVRNFAAKANTTADIDLSVSTDLNQLKAQINEAAQAVSDFAAKSGIVGDVKIKVQVDDSSLAETSADIAAFAAKTDGIEDIHLKVTTDAGSLDTVRAGLNAATKEANAFTDQIGRANSASLNLADDTQQAERFTDEMLRAANAVQSYSRKVTEIPTPKLQAVKPPPITVNTEEVERALEALGTRLRIAQANAELFGDQFQSDKLKLVAYQQALNQLVSAGLKPTSKEVLRVADNIERLADELQQAEKHTAQLELFASFKATGKIIPDLEAKAKRLQTALRNATDVKDIERYQKRLAAVNNDLARFGSRGIAGVKGVNQSMGNLAGAAGQVNMEFARIIQDVPYGMMGIGNNIQQLTANFGQLQRSAGGTGAALKATLASMITPASLLTIGIAALTSGWIMYQEYSRKSADTTAEIASEMEKAAKATDDYLGSLSGINKARAEGLRDAQKEIVTLKLLYERTQDTTLSLQERMKAVDELQEQYPEYFKNLKDEEILTGRAAEQYKLLTAELIRAASARAALSLIEKKAEERAVNKLRINDLKEQQKEQEKTVQQAQKLRTAMDAAAASSASMLGGTGSVSGANKVYKLQEAYEATGKSIDDLIERNQKLDKEMLLLAPEAAPALFKDEKETGGGSAGKLKEQTDYIAEMIKAFNLATKQALIYGDSFDVIGAKVAAVRTAINGLLESGVKADSSQIVFLQAMLDRLNDTNLEKLKMTFADLSGKIIPHFSETFAREALEAAVAFDPLMSKLDKVSEGMKAFLDEQAAMSQSEFNIESGNFMGITQGIDTVLSKMAEGYEKVEAMRALIGGAVVNAFSTLGAGLANMFQGLATGADALANMGRALLDTMGQIAAEFGKKLIAIGAGELLMGIPTGAAKIAAGVALIALGGVGSGLASGRAGGAGAPNVATSISGTGGYRGSIAHDGPEELVARVTGDQIEFVLARRTYKNKRFGSG